MSKPYKNYDSKFKAKIAIEVLQNDADILEICKNHNVPKTTVLDWKNKLLEEAASIFIPQSEKEKVVRTFKQDIEIMKRIIGEITIENNFLKKKLQK